ncbi:conserved hypothetical protein [Verticillium alfalfae VaMs.102]|uniref:Uncharacterized protein n=2 Tax=Verticillium TaxID=1036719 RepID=C9SUK6_VERA1|nr:conserved hypothetical protein [Verticillium alfalfae VaMs.102]EEY22116.1 conserved hypothetical protein [Verticillium alfalfae VaMs.102]
MNNQERMGSSSPQAIKLQMDQSAVDSSAGSPPALSSSPSDRRASTDEWDASKVPPSRFQKRKGSIYATPGSRDGHVDRNYASGFHEKHTEKGYGKAETKH